MIVESLLPVTIPALKIKGITAASYTLQESDTNSAFYINFAGTCTITIPATLSVGWTAAFYNEHAFENVVFEGAGIITSKRGLTLPGGNSSCTIISKEVGSVNLIGDLTT